MEAPSVSTPPAPAKYDLRLAALRAQLLSRGLDAYVLFSTDAHLNEFVPPAAQRIEALCGFSGSLAEVLITAESAHLFVDSRYHLQAEQESPQMTIHKLGTPRAQNLSQCLGALEQNAPFTERGLQVGSDGHVLTQVDAQRLRAALQHPRSSLQALDANLVDAVWEDRPQASVSAPYALDARFCGLTSAEKLARLRAMLHEQQATATVLIKLDEIAWLTNLRGADVPYNPVFEAYLIVEHERARCFTDAPVAEELVAAQAALWEFAPLRAWPSALDELRRRGERVWIPKEQLTEAIRQALTEPAGVSSEDVSPAGPAAAKPNAAGSNAAKRTAERATAEIQMDSPGAVSLLKSRKQAAEVEASVEAHLQAACAKFSSWVELEERLGRGQRLSEADYADLLQAHYERQAGYVSLSFPTIAAYGANAAIVHYSHPSAAVWLRGDGLLLVDSGIQAHGATTDDTRTWIIGSARAAWKRYYTRVLRGHIQLASLCFPQGTRGDQLDSIARAALWRGGLDYGHGTGHGVGAFLNVHEGPYHISSGARRALPARVILSIEPGVYDPSWGGVRLENLYVVEEASRETFAVECPAGESAAWLSFRALTMLPFDRRLIDGSLLASEERAWLANYQAQVMKRLGPRLDVRLVPSLERCCQLP